MEEENCCNKRRTAKIKLQVLELNFALHSAPVFEDLTREC